MKCILIHSVDSNSPFLLLFQQESFTLSNSFVVPMFSNGTSRLYLEWKKTGSTSSRWHIASPSNFDGGQPFSLSVLADYEDLWYVVIPFTNI